MLISELINKVTHIMEKEMAAHSNIHAWRISWTEESGRLQSMESQRVEHNQATNTKHTLVIFNTLYHQTLNSQS